MADFITGLVHWWEDTYGLPDWPLIGKQVIEPNIQHHLDPTAFARMNSMFSRNWQPMLVAAVVLTALWCVGWFCWQIALIAVLAACGNEAHVWSHVRPRSRVVRLLQDAAILQTPQQHAKHHRAPYDQYFCTLTNITNAALEASRFWKAAEWCISKFGIQPKRMTESRSFV